jgi:hypothetical protein
VITAVDTSVLLDVFLADARFGTRSRDALRRALSNGRAIACDVVWAETASCFPTSEAARHALSQLRIELVPMDEKAALLAGHVWKEYRHGGGKRDRVVADFLIGAHALAASEGLLTRDRGFYRKYFGKLKVVDPSAGSGA